MANVLGMIATCLKLVLLIVALHWHIPAGMAQSGVHTVTHDDIVRSGITRLSDLFALAGGWAVTSIDGYHWDAAPIGVDQPDSWQLFVDSIPLDVRAIDRHRLNLLPINVSEICRVEFHSRPVVIGGMAALRGAINIHTCKPIHNLAVKGAAAVANEAGDPGPWRYTPEAVPNVDRSGPTMQVSVAWANAKTALRIQAGADEHHATDPRIRTRVHTLYRGEKDARILLRNAQLEITRTRHRLKVAAAQSQDFLYSTLVGLDVPIDHDVRYFQLSGGWRPLKYFLIASQNDISTRANPKNANVDLKQFTLNGRLLASSPLNIRHLSIGLSGRLTQADSSLALPSIHLLKVERLRNGMCLGPQYSNPRSLALSDLMAANLDLPPWSHLHSKSPDWTSPSY